MNNWCICWFFKHILLGILIFKGLIARRLCKSFGVKGLMDFFQSALFLTLFSICNFEFINILLYTIPPSVFFVRHLILTNESISKSPNSCINSLYIAFSNFHVLEFPQTFFLKLFFQIGRPFIVFIFSEQWFCIIIGYTCFVFGATHCLAASVI
jgi:hypothetical protein